MIPKGCVGAAPPRVKGFDTTLEVELLLLASRRELRVLLPSGWRSNNGKKQSFEQSDRNPPVTNWGGTEAEGGQLPTPAGSESRVTQPGPAPSANAGITNYDTADSADQVQDEAEREG